MKKPAPASTVFSIDGELDKTLVDRIAFIESRGNPKAKAKFGTASGKFQFIASTWLNTVRRHEPSLLKGKTRQEVLQMRFDEDISTRMFVAFTKDNIKFLKKNSLDITPRNIYLAHFLGPSGARKALKASPTKSVKEVFGAKVVKNNPFLKGKDINFLLNWAERKMKG